VPLGLLAYYEVSLRLLVLQVENVRPVTPDMEAMEAISRAVEERAQIVTATQQELLEAQRNQDMIDEQEFYAEVSNREKFFFFFPRFDNVNCQQQLLCLPSFTSVDTRHHFYPSGWRTLREFSDLRDFCFHFR
jgi:hypothetical protein